MKQPKLYLSHIIKAINTIQEYLKGFSYNEFLKDEKTQDAVIRNLEIIGEASSKLEQNFIEKLPQIPWRDIKDFRNKLIHDYWELNLEVIWEAATKETPQLKKLLESVLGKLKD